MVTLIVVDIDESGSGPVDNGRAEEHDVVPGGDEVQGAQVGDQVPSQAAGVVEVEFLQGFAGAEPCGADAPPPWLDWSQGGPGRGSKFGCRTGVSFHVPPTPFREGARQFCR